MGNQYVKEPVEQRFMRHVDDSAGEHGCWPWTASKTRGGYGQFSIGRQNRSAHRVSYELFVGPIPEGLGLDHRCHTRDESCPGGKGCPHRCCVNPAHLEPVSRQENITIGRSFSGVNAAKTHCVRGHELAGENLRISPGGRRICKACKQAWKDINEPRKGPRTHCKRGHEFTPENTYVTPTGKRSCRTCLRERNAAATARRVAVTAETGERRKPTKPYCVHGHALTDDNLYYGKTGYPSCKTCRDEKNANNNAKRAAARVAAPFSSHKP